MDPLSKRRNILWAAWLFIVPPGLFLIYQYYPPPSLELADVLAYLAFFVLACLFPMNISGVPTYLVQWLTVAVFLKYGLFVEVILSQLTMIIVILRLRTSESLSVRIPFNSMMFFTISAIAGLTFLFAGGEIASLNLVDVIVFGLLFQTVSFVANQFILYGYARILREHKDFFSLDTIWDFAITFLVFPFSIALYMSEAYFGLTALLLLGIPFFTMTAIIHMYTNSEKVNNDLKKAGVIGHQLAARLSSDEVFDQFVIQVAKLFKVDFAYVIDFRDGQLLMLRKFEENQFQPLDTQPINYDEGIGGKAIIENDSYMFSSKSQWKSMPTEYIHPDSESLMAMPISRNNKIEGVLVLAARRKHAFHNHQLQILDILSTYFAVSLEKAVLVQKAIAKSERCGLTKLYNYRYLDEAIGKCMDQVNNGELDNLSVIMMDIDYFKAINDKYGHQSGNEILVELANLLTDMVSSEGTVARYGGEEFVILLPGYSKEVSMLFAENIRKEIEKHQFTIHSDLDDNRGTVGIQITMSIGVSSAPDDSDDAMAMIRNADRALYIGAKQAGRNKVAAYTK
ncbi:sensor domain-containing diguanylate cyclase [Planococcus sp. A6]|uniref:sensor domain-containing diguanylate cyclase n=1 Tax=Planococcus sp. A6 TaxID=2992760 RepID=UPI00237C1E67|nr:sensor domain-containing diguanylate cyclase [Planococcus sp. A6]MDE0583626.1 sensor domain-containing diguanylate cyclase [Planococcus sp. A6]